MGVQTGFGRIPVTVPTNHRLAERKLIRLVQVGEWEIDAEGRIWRVCTRSGLKAGGSHLIPCERRRVEKLLPSGYLMVRAMIDGKRVCGLAHRLVWQHFNGDIAPGFTVNHDNGCKGQNWPDNLLLASYSAQQVHAQATGLRDQRGEGNPNAKLSEADVSAVVEAYIPGETTLDQVAAAFRISPQHVSRLVRGERRATPNGRGNRLQHDAMPEVR